VKVILEYKIRHREAIAGFYVVLARKALNSSEDKSEDNSDNQPTAQHIMNGKKTLYVIDFGSY
jgi:hypothetical protein